MRRESRPEPALELLEAYLRFARSRGGALPSFDRWLGIELKERRGALGASERGRLVTELFTALRFAWLSFFLERAYQEVAGGFRWRSAKSAASRKVPAGKLESALSTFRATVRRDGVGAVLEWLVDTGPQALLTWSRLRAGAQAPGAADRADFFAQARTLLELSRDPRDRLLWCGLAPFLETELEARAKTSGWELERRLRFIDLHAQIPPLWLRLNAPGREREVLGELERAGLRPKREGAAAIEVEGPRSIYELESFRSGAIEIQDLASQCLGESVRAKPGERLWDCCAGQGGKTLLLAAALEGRGFIYASDIHEKKLESLKLRVRRTGLSNVRTVPWDGGALPEFGPEMQGAGGFDAVLVDAPCTSSGTWRRNPDFRLRTHPSDALAAARLQGQLLAVASRAVRPGGRLVYGTCSWFVGENEQVVDKFLKTCGGDFALEGQAMHGAPDRNADAMFSAVLRKVPLPRG